jgi:hypothetical protein
MTQNISYSVGAKSITVMKDGDIHMLDDSDKRFAKIKAHLQENPPRVEEALKLMDLKDVIKKVSAGRVVITAQGVTFEGNSLSGYMAERLMDMAGAGMDVKPWMLFMDNLQENPQKDIREDVFKWMEAGKMPITEDGCIVAFKKVRHDYKDVHSGKFDNSVGAVVSMPREKCDTNRNRTCSTGLHFCSADYLRNFSGSRVMIVKVDPRDVTAIPSDYNNSKGRCCRYEVTGELSNESAAKHKVFAEPVMPEDPSEIPDLMAPKSKGPPSPIGRSDSSRKVAANPAAIPKGTAKKSSGASKESSVKTSTTKKSTPKKSATKKATGTVAKATKSATKTVTKATKSVGKAASKIAAGLADALTDVVAPTKSTAKRTTVKVTKTAPASKAPAKTTAKSKAPAKSTTKTTSVKTPAKTKKPSAAKTTTTSVAKSKNPGRVVNKTPAKATKTTAAKPSTRSKPRKK